MTQSRISAVMHESISLLRSIIAIMLSIGSRRALSSVTTKAIRWSASSARTVPLKAVPSSNPGPRTLLWPGVFTLGFAGGCFGLASVSIYHEEKGYHQRLVESVPTCARDLWKRMDDMHPALPTFGPIIAANIIVWSCWKVFSPTSATMQRYFWHTAGQGRALPMVLSNFSHIGGFHLFGNMVGLWSFGVAVAQVFGPAETLAIYFSAGVASQFMSSCVAVLSKRPIKPSVGASGGVFALLSIWGCMNPESQVYFLIFPFVTFSAKKGIAALLCFDFVGLVRGWQVIDHAAHIGGAGLGIAFIRLGGFQYVVDYQKGIMWWYHTLLQQIAVTDGKSNSSSSDSGQ